MTDREKLIELIFKGEATTPCTRNPEFECGGIKCFSCEREAIADYLLAHGVTFATNKNDGGKWIGVAERLPEKGVWVMVYQDCGWIGVAQIEEDGWHWYTQDLVKLSDPTHWMPLPEPPKEE